MKNIARHLAVLCVAALFPAASAKAQAYEIANRIPQMIMPALSGSFNYRGYVDVSYSKGVGDYNADFLDVATSQGFQYARWLFMGVGMGVDGVFTHPDDDWGIGWAGNPGYDDYVSHDSSTSCVMIPIFTDFRFNVGSSTGASFFASLKIGCAFLMGDNYLRINNGYLTNNEYFYLKPTLGVRIPVSPQNRPKQAINVGVNYQLLTSNYWYGPSCTATINALGVTVGFEW